MAALIYYYSKGIIEQVCYDLLGRVYEEQTSVSKKGAAKISAGLSQFLKNFIGITPDLEINGERESLKSKKYVGNLTDRLVDLVKKSNALSITDFTELKNNPNEVIYKFDLDLRLNEMHTNKGEDNMIMIKYEDDKFCIEGITSKSNWTSLSLLNNVLYTNNVYSDANLGKISGLLSPIKIIVKEDKIFINAQFLILFKHGE